MRNATSERRTQETDITVELALDGEGRAKVDTGLPFMDHMLTAFARHGRFDLTVAATGDLDVDAHHTMEDLGLVLGQAIADALGDKVAICRFGAALIPMDEALARVVVDLSGRPWLSYRFRPSAAVAGGIQVRLFREFFQALVGNARLTLHVDLLAGEEIHHSLEAVFKAFGRALRQATGLDPDGVGVPSTKGLLD